MEMIQFRAEINKIETEKNNAKDQGNQELVI